MATDGAWIKVNVFLSQVPKKRKGNVDHKKRERKR